MKIREITNEDRHNPRILEAINQIIGRTSKDIAFILIEPENGEDLFVRPDIPQFSQNVLNGTRDPIIKVCSSNNINDFQCFDSIHSVDGMSVRPFYDELEKPTIGTVTSGPIVASTLATP